MKSLISVVISLMCYLCLVSCDNTSDDNPQFHSTTVKGHVIDTERNIGYSNDLIELSARYSCGSGFNSGYCYEFIASTVTDAEGYYEFNFEYDIDKSYSVRRISDYTYYDESLEQPLIEPGDTNIINFEGWRPVIFKVNLRVLNNVFPDLHINSRDEDDLQGLYNFPYRSISAETVIDTLVYLEGKPNANMSIAFSYKDDSPTFNYHERREHIVTMIQDTITMSYQVDCSAF